MNQKTIRIALAAGIIWYAVGGPGGSLPDIGGGQYSGSLRSVNEAAAKMAATDRTGLSESMNAAARMLEQDKAGLITSTEALQQFIRGTTAYGYSSFSVAKYPDVADAVQEQLEKAVGSKVGPLDPSTKNETVETLKELAKAIQ